MPFMLSIILCAVFAVAAVVLIYSGGKTKKRIFYVLAGGSIITSLILVSYGILSILLSHGID